MSDTNQSDDGRVTSRRRRLLNWLAGLGIAGFFAGLVTPLKDLSVVAEQVGEDSEKTNLPGQQLVFAHAHEKDPQHVHEAGNYVEAGHLATPDAALVYPEDLSQDDDYLVLLHRLEPDQLEEPTDLDMTDQGYVAYSAICTHLGCTVNYTSADHDAISGPHDHCPCHVGEFDPYRGAEVVGGPAPKPLPQIGVTVNDDGILEVASEFEEGVGGE